MAVSKMRIIMKTAANLRKHGYSKKEALRRAWQSARHLGK